MTDLGSLNGTIVEGRLISKRTLVEGEVVRFGANTAFRFALMDDQYERLLRQLYRSSVRDPMTGAFNRHYFDDRLRVEGAYARRHGTNLSVCIFDLDHFKGVNDRFGHLAGDCVLREVADAAASRLRTEDVFARFGGEEFAVILRGIDIQGAARVGERLRGGIDGFAIRHEGELVSVTISVGCASLSCSSTVQIEDVVAIADRRLYAAKRSGRNAVVATDTDA